MAEVAAGLVGVAFGRTSGWREDIYHWQPALRRGREYIVIVAGGGSATVIERITGEPLIVSEVEQILTARMDWVDDNKWCQRLATELDLKDVALDLHRRAKVSAAVKVRGPDDPLHDGRLLTVARRSRDFKKLPAVAVHCGDSCLTIFEPGKEARARVSGEVLRSTGPVTRERRRNRAARWLLGRRARCQEVRAVAS